MCLMENTYELERLTQAYGSIAMGHEFNVNEATMLHMQKKKEGICQSVLEAAQLSAKVPSIVNDKAMEKLEKRS